MIRYAPCSVLFRFAVTSASSGRAKPSAWPEAPHVALANSPLKASAVAAFTKKYGPLIEPAIRFADGVRRIGAGGLTDTATELTPQKARRLGMDGALHETFSFSLHDFAEAQDRIRWAWRGERTALTTLRQGVMTANFQVSPFRDSKVLLWTPALWEFISLIFLTDYDTGRARICRNPDAKHRTSCSSGQTNNVAVIFVPSKGITPAGRRGNGLRGSSDEHLQTWRRLLVQIPVARQADSRVSKNGQRQSCAEDRSCSPYALGGGAC